MSPLAEFELVLERVIAHLTGNLGNPALHEFDQVWEGANRVCDDYEICNPD
ncbi:MAG TPA: hypothetical protein VFA89_24630 [Terriglobales bacterium]|nr:hypothetical protein [Terriglobales bacterium]